MKTKVPTKAGLDLGHLLQTLEQDGQIYTALVMLSVSGAALPKGTAEIDLFEVRLEEIILAAHEEMVELGDDRVGKSRIAIALAAALLKLGSQGIQTGSQNGRGKRKTNRKKAKTPANDGNGK